MVRDLGRIHPQRWTENSRPYPWRQAAWLSYALGGWPVFVVAAAWRTSEPRSRVVRVHEIPRRAREPHDA
jgi:hypothetical protein